MTYQSEAGIEFYSENNNKETNLYVSETIGIDHDFVIPLQRSLDRCRMLTVRPISVNIGRYCSRLKSIRKRYGGMIFSGECVDFQLSDKCFHSPCLCIYGTDSQ
jgi:hypothetical protein